MTDHCLEQIYPKSKYLRLSNCNNAGSRNQLFVHTDKQHIVSDGMCIQGTANKSITMGQCSNVAQNQLWLIAFKVILLPIIINGHF